MAGRDRPVFSTVLSNSDSCGQESVETVYPGVPIQSQIDFKVPNFPRSKTTLFEIWVRIPAWAISFFFFLFSEILVLILLNIFAYISYTNYLFIHF